MTMTLSKFAARTLLIAVAAVSATGTVVSNANACGGEWYPYVEIEQIDYRPMVVGQAEKKIEKGELELAAGMIIRSMPHIKTLNPSKAKIVARAQRVLAVATIRNDGVLPIGDELPQRIQSTWLGNTAEDQRANLEWAVSSLEKIAESKADDPALQTELAEGLAKLGKKDEAKTTLETLATKDLISSPEGWAALAELRGTSGDDAGKQAALKRCSAMAKEPEMCVAGHTTSAAS
jgi:predicted Zn-dependent protease